MADTKIIVYASDWCPDCRRARRYLDRHQITYEWVNIDRDSQAESYVKKVNQGNRSVPTIVFPDGDVLVEPDENELAHKLGLPVS